MTEPTKPITDPKEWYLKQFAELENRLNGDRESYFYEIRRQAIDRFKALEFPTQKNEDWRFTDINPILEQNFTTAQEKKEYSRSEINPFLYDAVSGQVLVFVNGRYRVELSRFNPEGDDLICCAMTDAIDRHRPLIQTYLNRYDQEDIQAVFSVLNTAFMDDGVFIFVPENRIISSPIQMLFLSDCASERIISNPRNLIIVGKNSRLELFESHHYLSECQYFTNQVTEVVLDEGATVFHTKIQDEALASFHIATCQVHQEAGSNYSSVNIDLGSAIVRNDLKTVLNAENCEAHMYGFYLGLKNQLIDNHTCIDHAKPNCESNELYKGILSDQAAGVFNGKVFVRPDAQKTNAYQQNQCLLLSDDANINTKPQLEIFADDVICSHGATIGALDEEMLFYLRSRGISAVKASSMLQYAFASDIFNRIDNEAIRERVDQRVMAKFESINSIM